MSKTPETLTSEECTRLLSSFNFNLENPLFESLEIRNYTMTLLMLDAGLRVGEVVKLLISDLCYHGHPVNSLVIRDEISKSKRERTIPPSARLNYAIELMNGCWWDKRDPAGTKFAFYRFWYRQHITARQLRRIINFVSINSIGRRINPHVLRHTFASRLMRKCNARIVQELLGHKSLQSTQIYTHPNSDDLKKAIDSLTSNS